MAIAEIMEMIVVPGVVKDLESAVRDESTSGARTSALEVRSDSVSKEVIVRGVWRPLSRVGFGRIVVCLALFFEAPISGGELKDPVLWEISRVRDAVVMRLPTVRSMLAFADTGLKVDITRTS